MTGEHPPDSDFFFGVVVDPAEWPSSKLRLAQTIADCLAQLDDASTHLGARQLSALLRSGPATVVSRLTRARALHVLDRLRALKVPAKVTRLRRPSAEQRAVEARVGKKPITEPGWPTAAAPLPAADKATTDRFATADLPAIGATPPAGIEAVSPIPRDGPPIVGWGDVVGARVDGRGSPAVDPSAVPPEQPEVDDDPDDHHTHWPETTLQPEAVEPPDPEETPDDLPTALAEAVAESEASRAAAPLPDDAGMAPPRERRPQRQPPEGPVGEAPRVRLAQVFSALAPGAGHMYLGDTEAAKGYALSAPLIVPWIQSVAAAGRRARQLSTARRRTHSFKPSIPRAAGFVVLFWIIAAGLAFGSIGLYRSLTRPDTNVTSPAVETQPEAEPTGDHDTTQSADADAGAQDEAHPADSLSAEAEARRQRVQAQRLLLDAQRTCRLGLYEYCAHLACQAREADPGLTEAVRLCHEASMIARDRSGEPEGTGEQP